MQQHDDEWTADDAAGRLPPQADEAARPPGPKRIDVCGLLGGDREVVLSYRGADYRLRVTSNDKLILTK